MNFHPFLCLVVRDNGEIGVVAFGMQGQKKMMLKNEMESKEERKK